VSDEEPKQKFKRLLEGELIDWKEHAMRLTDVMVAAEIREKEFCQESTYWMQAMNEMYKTLGYTEEQIEFAHQQYEKWYDKNEESPF